MGKTLIIAEKPAQAREYAKVLGIRGKGEGFLENDSYIITWCVGHLLELAKPEFYMDLNKAGKRWSLQRLPVLPGLNFHHTVKANTRKQYNIVKQLLKSSSVERVICGTDADREGQLLFQEVWDEVKCSKPLSRLWISSLTQEAITEGMRHLRPVESVAGLAAAGYGRAYSDWDFGMNLTEGFTALFGSFDSVQKKPNVISIGRVQTPTLALLAEREWEIQAFVPETYFEVRADFIAAQGEYSGSWLAPEGEEKRLTDRQQAEAIIDKVKEKSGKIVKLESKKITEPAPFLFDLTSLSVTASKRYGFGAERVLKVAQALYEKKAITYPRTDCVYLPSDMIPKLPDHLNAVRQGPYLKLAEEAAAYSVPKGKRVINSITAHHAIIPTTEKIVLEKLSEDESKLYDLIVRRYLAVWFPPAQYDQTEVITEVEKENFRTRGKIMLSPGWKKVYSFEDDKKSSADDEKNENIRLPQLTWGEAVQTKEAVIEEKVTKPPKRYTQGELLKAMESAGKQIDDEILRQKLKGKGLGTVATRPAIIQALLDRGYIFQEQKTLKPTEKGLELIRLIRDKLPRARLLVSAEMTGQMEFDLAKVEQGDLTLAAYLTEVEENIRLIITELRDYEQKHGKTPIAAVTTGKAGRKTRNSKTDSPDKLKKGRNQTQSEKIIKSEEPINSQISNISKTAEARMISQPSQPNRSGKIYETANVSEILDDKAIEKTKLVKVNEKTEKESLGSCPRCGGAIIEGNRGYGCTNWRQGCKFVLWKNPICGKVLTPTQVRSLLKKGKTSLIKGFKSKNGKSFAAYLCWEDKPLGKLKFEFQ